MRLSAVWGAVSGFAIRRLLRCDAAVEVEQLAGRRLPSELRGTREAVGRLICADLPVGFEAEQLGRDRLFVERIDQDGAFAGDLGDRRRIRSDHRSSAGHRL